MEQNLNDLYYVIHYLKEIIDEFNNEINALSQRVDALNREVKNKEDTIKTLQNNKESSDKEKKDSDNKCKKLQGKLEQLQKEYSNKLANLTSEYQAEIESLKSTYQNSIGGLTEENNNLKSKNTVLINENNRLKADVENTKHSKDTDTANVCVLDDFSDFGERQENPEDILQGQEEISERDNISENGEKTGADTDECFPDPEEEQKSQNERCQRQEKEQKQRKKETEKGAPSWAPPLVDDGNE